MTEGLSSGAFFVERGEAKTVLVLNRAIELDREAMATLLRTRVVVNKELTEQSELYVAEGEDGYTLSVIGLINSVLCPNGLPMVTACYSNDGAGLRLDGIVGYYPVRG